MDRRTALLPLVLFLALAALVVWRLVLMDRGDLPKDIPTVMLDKPVPTFDLPPVAAGQPGLSTADFKGKVTLVNFFATWCVPCREEHALLANLTDKVAVVGIAYKDNAAAVQNYLAGQGNPYRQVGADADGRVAIDFGVYGVPESYLVDGEGRIRYAWKKPFTPEEIRTRLLPLVAALTP
jgi:DsbE subfamily thiol:disulfide oxidoreductase